MKKIFNYFKVKPFRIFFLVSFLLCAFFAIVFQPITWQAQGDAPSYVELAKQFLGISTDFVDLSNRQPLYSILIAPFIFIFGETFFIYPLMWFQFLMVFFSSIFVYKIFEELNLFKCHPFITAVCYLLNISTIYYGFSVLSETLALFIYTFIVFILVKYEKNQSLKLIFFLGILNGLMVLARFNAMGLPLFTMGGLVLIHFHHYQFKKVKRFLIHMSLYCFALFFVLNFWMLYNYTHRGFYGIIQKDNPRASLILYREIDENVVVSDNHKDVLNIFLMARKKLQEKNSFKQVTIKSGSLLKYPWLKKIYSFFKGGDDSVGGWDLYKEARNDLMIYFNLDVNDPTSITTLGKKLAPFNEELKRQTKDHLMLLRFSALFQTLRQTGGVLPVKGSLNLNILPSFIFLLYRLVFIPMMFFTLTISLILFVIKIFNVVRFDKFMLLVLIMLVLYFPISHFIAISPGDANRFKFPSEPIIIGLFVYYFYEGINLIKDKLRLFITNFRR